jgi:hypothetical protein
MKSGSTSYSTGSFWPDLPNGRIISGWLHQFSGKLIVHSGVDVTQLTISKFLRNPPSICAAWQPPAFEQLEYCWPWNIGLPPIDPILSGSWGYQPSKERIITDTPCATWYKLPCRPDGRVQLTNLGKSLCNCPHRSTIEKCHVLAGDQKSWFSILAQLFFEIFVLHLVRPGVFRVFSTGYFKTEYVLQ